MTKAPNPPGRSIALAFALLVGLVLGFLYLVNLLDGSIAR